MEIKSKDIRFQIYPFLFHSMFVYLELGNDFDPEFDPSTIRDQLIPVTILSKEMVTWLFYNMELKSQLLLVLMVYNDTTLLNWAKQTFDILKPGDLTHAISLNILDIDPLLDLGYTCDIHSIYQNQSDKVIRNQMRLKNYLFLDKLVSIYNWVYIQFYIHDSFVDAFFDRHPNIHVTRRLHLPAIHDSEDET